MTDICTKKTAAIISLLEKREISSEDLVRAHLDRIMKYDSVLRCYISLADPDDIIAEARESDNRRISGRSLGPLDGVPLAVKDNIHCAGLATSCGSQILAGYNPPFEATAVTRIRSRGGIVLGKTNLDEFAMGSTCEYSSMQVTRNPWDMTRVPGGSSGGSAAAVSAGLAPLALGSDTGGSIRQPASFCGIVGLKPTYGAVSRYGLAAYASSLDQIGPMARDVYGCALLLGLMSGFDERDSTSLDFPPLDIKSAGTKGLAGARIACFTELLSGELPDKTRDHFMKTLDRLRDMGASVAEVPFPAIKFATAAYYFIATAEASSNLSRYDGVKYGFRSGRQGSYQEMLFSTRSAGFGKEVKKRILLGNFVLSSGYYDEYYRKAQKVRAWLRDEMVRLLGEYDFIAMPTSPDTAYPLGQSASDPLKMYLADITTVLPNLAGLPAISVPSGLIDGLPMGLQLIGRPLDEEGLLGAACEFESGLGLELVPPMSVGSVSGAVPEASGSSRGADEGPRPAMYTMDSIRELSRSYSVKHEISADRTLCIDLGSMIGREAVVCGWVHRIRSLGGIEFYELRDRSGFTQLVLEGVKGGRRVNLETVIEARGTVAREERSPFGGIEVRVESMRVLGSSEGDMPVSVNAPPQAAGLPATLDNRVISVRNPGIRPVFAVQSEIIRLFQEYLRSHGFTEIKSPKIISSGTEGGTNIFEVKYFDRTAFLAQSPQFYKQIMVGSGFERVFEVGPVFRAELHDTVRHLNEYTSMDFEMGFITDERDVIGMQEEMLRHMVAGLNSTCAGILAEFGIPLEFPERIPRIHFLEALDIIGSRGVRDAEEGDISPEGEKALCAYCEEKLGSQFVYVFGYPVGKRPMYAMPDERLPGYTRSFDLLFRGIEITTGGQRINDYNMLKENIRAFGQNPADFREYLDAFKYGMPPHGGLGMGLERMTMKILGLKNIREAALFPRDMNRITP